MYKLYYIILHILCSLYDVSNWIIKFDFKTEFLKTVYNPNLNHGKRERHLTVNWTAIHSEWFIHYGILQALLKQCCRGTCQQGK